MINLEDQLLIHELAERAGVSVRTIRYYIAEGLLPAPTTRGRYAYYSQEYLDLIELIRRLKEAYLPLREIRALVDKLKPDGARELLEKNSGMPLEELLKDVRALSQLNNTESVHYEMDSAGFVDEANVDYLSAADYARKVQEGNKPRRKEQQPPSERPTQVPDFLPEWQINECNEGILVPAPEPVSRMALPVNVDTNAWQRIVLAPGVELHFQLSAGSKLKEKIGELIEFARGIFT